MTEHFTLSTARDIFNKTNGEAPHTLAVVVFLVGDGYCFGVVEGASGVCIAWDGVYFDEQIPQSTPLGDLDWDDWDDMSSKYVLRAQREWLSGPLGFWLMPTYSVAKEAAELVNSWGDSEKGDAQAGPGGQLVCYLPVFDHAAYEAHLTHAREEREKVAKRLR